MKTDTDRAVAKSLLADLCRALPERSFGNERRFGIAVEPKLPKVREQPWYRKGQRW